MAAFSDTDTLKRCTKCEQALDRSNFSVDRSKKDGLHPQCSPCRSEARAGKWSGPERIEYNRRWREKNADRFRWYQLKYQYGITKEDYEELLEKQNGVCAICEQEDDGDRPLAVDHCHETDAVRGLLCFRCNMAIGYFQDDPRRLEAAARYLEVRR